MISIVVITKDNPRELSLTLESLTMNPSIELEIIVVDGSIKYPCPLPIEQIGNISMKRLVQKGTGIYSALNQGMQASKGNYITWVNSGDKCNMTFLMESEIILSESMRDWSYGNVIYLDENGVFQEKIKRRYCNSLLLRFGIRFIPHPGSLFSREFIIQNNLLYEEDIGYIADQVFLFDALQISKPISTNLYVVSMMTNGISMLTSYDKKFELWHAWRKKRNLLFLNSEKCDLKLKKFLHALAIFDYKLSIILGRRRFD